MKLTFNAHLFLQLVFIAIQTLVPAFFTSLTPEQKIAIGLCVSGMQAVLGLKAVAQDPEGNPLKLTYVNLKREWKSAFNHDQPKQSS